MSETRKTCGMGRIGNHGLSVAKSAVASRPVLAALGVVCGALFLLAAVAASAQERPRPAVTATTYALRQMQKAETIYRIEAPVRLQETTVKVELGSPEALEGWWRFLLETESGSSGESATFPKALQALRELGETKVLHSGVCLLSHNEQASVYSSSRVPAETSRVGSGGRTVTAVEYRDLGRRLSAHLEGIDAQGRVCFSYNIELNYIVAKPDTANPAFSSFNAEGRARVRVGETLVIPNFDGSSGLLVFLTPRLVR